MQDRGKSCEALGKGKAFPLLSEEKRGTTFGVVTTWRADQEKAGKRETKAMIGGNWYRERNALHWVANSSPKPNLQKKITGNRENGRGLFRGTEGVTS